MKTELDVPETFPKEARLLSSPEFRRVFDGKQSVSDDTLIVYAAKTKATRSRLGLAVSRKIGNAVVRNAWKRRIREAFRTQQTQLPVGYDFVVLPRRGVAVNGMRIRRSLLSLGRRAAERCDRNGGKPSSKKRRHFGRGKGKQ